MNTLIKLIPAALLCASSAAMAMTENTSAPEQVRVPAGHAVKLLTVGIGEITYACREKADQPGTHAWTFVAPVAALYDKNKAVVGKYYGGPTWEAADGSKVSGKQLGVAPGGIGNIALQLVQAAPATGMGAMSGVSYIQRLNTRGGVPADLPCSMANAGAEQKVGYQADYIFYAMQ